jgi:hypothetical protein
MISIPFELNDKKPASVLEDDLGRYDNTQWRLLRYVNRAQNKEYPVDGDFDDFEPGKGFWLITKDSKSLDAGAGRSVTTAKNYFITLPPGWSQIGNPFHFTVNWSEVIKTRSVGDSLVGYQGSLNELSGYDYTRKQLIPGEGYFVYNRDNNSTTIEIPPKAATSTSTLQKTNAPRFQSDEWALQITAVCDGHIDKDNYIGAFHDADDAWDHHDFPEAPFFDQHVALYFPHPEWKKYPDLYTGDFRAVKPEGDYWDFVVRSEVAKSEVILRLADIRNVPAVWEVILLDKTSRVAINFSEEKQYAFPSVNGKTMREFRIVVGKKGFVETNDLNLAGVPQAFVLEQNFPNPFNRATASLPQNPETTIRFGFPTKSMVTIKIFDLTGREIAALLNHVELPAGRHQLVWDGRNEQGQAMVNGIYLYRLQAVDPLKGAVSFAKTLKLTLVR